MQSLKHKCAAIIGVFLISGACKSMDAHQAQASGKDTVDANTSIQNRAQPDQGISDEQKAVMLEKLQDAIEEAQRTGKTRIDVFLDEVPGKVQTMDLVKVAYRAEMEGGQEIPPAQDTLQDGKGRTVETLIAGKPARIPGLENAILDMGLEKKRLIIAPENAFGLYKAEERKDFHSVRTFPLVMDIDANAYQAQFNRIPSVGEQVRINPYFESQVIEAADGRIWIKNLAKNNHREASPIGPTTVIVNEGTITLKLDPIVGAPFTAGKRQGKIVSAEGDKFTVDFNHPLAGQSIMVDLEVIGITKPSVYKDHKVTWIEDHDLGSDQALADRKDKVLVLYADWCKWCEKLFDQTFTDPRIAMLKDRFVFVKANSDEDQSLKALYGQEGFPMVVLSDYRGKIYKKFEGFKNAQNMLSLLERIMNNEPTETDT